MLNQSGLKDAIDHKIDTTKFVDPLAAARKQRLAVAGDALATAGVEVHGDNTSGNVSKSM